MISNLLNYTINGKPFGYDVTAEAFTRGKDECSFRHNKVFTNSELLKNGYIIRQFPQLWHDNITAAITEFVRSKIEQASAPTSGFTLEKYHEFVSNDVHKQVVSSFRGGLFGLGGIHLKHLGIDYRDFDKFINASIGSNLSSNCKRYFFSVKHFWIRIIRPRTNDNNPPHKDTHIKRIQRNVNVYLPLAGSNSNSSLPLIPCSHLDKESDYIKSTSPCWVGDKKFNVPAIIERRGGLDMITPDPKRNEIMIFTPCIVHGGGVNSNADTTRVSLEMRFFK